MTKKILKERLPKELCKELLKPITREPMPPPPKFCAGAAYQKRQAKYVKDVEKWAKAIKQEKVIIDRKLALLLEHYNLSVDNPNCWRLLASLLAKEYIPGFRIETKANSGRPQIWDEDLFLDLYMAVEFKRNEAKAIGRKTTLENICSRLIKEDPWKFLPKCTDKVLYHRYAEACNHGLVKQLLHKDKEEPGYLMAFWKLGQ